MPLFARAPFQSIRDIADAERMWLPKKPGRLLDVGAGDGEFVARMRREGWDARGVEPDDTAVARAAERYGVDLMTGTIENVPSSKRFDAITLDNVIEHVTDPIETLRACWQRLVPRGRLLVLTPNVESAGHGRFRAGWRGLEPPRHLHLFSPSSLQIAAQRASVPEGTARTTSRALLFFWTSSAGAGTLSQELLSALRPQLGEEILLDVSFAKESFATHRGGLDANQSS